ncbi:MAG: D-alanine--D-alanine ligase [Deltaproteobacteria bacterium]|nr:D-alanine--D-alanine ligase [Deltaproteobacteria bacterium]
MNFKDKKVAVLMGGMSKEREISLRSGRAISSALQKQGYKITDIDVGWDVDQQLRQVKPDVAFIALHGRYGEDGCIQGLLEILKIPYTGSGPTASAVAMDKVLTKKALRLLDIHLPEDWVFHAGRVLHPNNQKTFETNCLRHLPLIVKPNREGSTIGMTIVRQKEELTAALKLALEHDSTVLVEQYIAGTEVTVGVINGRALPPLEIVPKSGFYDYQSKYTKGMTEYIVPARISPTLTEELKKTSEAVFHEMDLEGVARLDFIVSKDPQKKGVKDSPFFLEVNTIPGMTETSLVPKMAQAAGISFEQLAEEILQGASLKVSR